MSRLSFWLTGGKRFIENFKTIFQDRLDSIDDFSVLPPSSVINYSAYLSSTYKKSKGVSSSSLKVSSSDETFSFYRENKDNLGHRIVWLWDIAKIPSRYRAGLQQIASKYPSILKGHIFIPTDISYDLAEKSDFFLLKRQRWVEIFRELEGRLPSLLRRGERIPRFIDRFTTKEKLVLRLLFKMRRRAVSIDEISGYLYGRHMRKNLRASAFLIFALRKKIDRLTGRKNLIRNSRKFGYQIDFDILRDKNLIE